MKNLLWKCFELVINYYQGFIMTWFVYRFLNPKSLKQAKTFLSIFSIIFGTTITLLNHITLYEGFTSTLYLVILLVYAIIAFNDSIIKKLLSTIIPNIILLLITSVELNLLSSLNRISVKDLITNDNSVRFMTLIVIQISLWISLKIIIKLFKFSDSYTISDWSPIITVLISSFILVSLLHVLSLNADDTQRIYINLSYLVIIILNFLMFYVIYSLFFKNAQNIGGQTVFICSNARQAKDGGLVNHVIGNLKLFGNFLIGRRKSFFTLGMKRFISRFLNLSGDGFGYSLVPPAAEENMSGFANNVFKLVDNAEISACLSHFSFPLLSI